MMLFTVISRLLKSAFEKIIVNELMCNPCLRTPVTHVSSLYTWGGEKIRKKV
jgi:hypothetical protein